MRAQILCFRSLNKLQRSLVNQSGNLIEENEGKKWPEEEVRRMKHVCQ